MPEFFLTGMGKKFYEGSVPRIASALERIAAAMEHKPRVLLTLSTDRAANWENDDIQFPRLLAELKAVGLSPEQVKGLCASMDLTKEDIHDLLDRAEATWSDITSRESRG